MRCAWACAPISRIVPWPGASTPVRGGTEARPALSAANASASASTRGIGVERALDVGAAEDPVASEPGAQVSASRKPVGNR